MSSKLRNFTNKTTVGFNSSGKPVISGPNATVRLDEAATVVGGDTTIATTGNTDLYFTAPHAGTIAGIEFSGTDALAANDTNYLTFTVTNLGQAGGGSTALLAATNPNTTKATGGSAIAANTKRALTLHGTAANLVVAAGDRIRLRAAATGTLANTVTGVAYTLRYNKTL